MKKKALKKQIKKTSNVNKEGKNKDNFFNFFKQSNFLIPFILILIVMSVAFHVRSGPISLNGLDDRVEQNTLNQIQSIISQNINTQYPNLNEVYRQELIAEEYEKVIQSGVYDFNGQKIVVSEIVAQNSEGIKNAFKAENGQTYLNAIDPYHFLRLSENYQINGDTGNTLNDGEAWIDYKVAPVGIKGIENVDFHIWLESFLYNFNNLDENSSVGEQTKAVFLIPVIFAMLSVIPIFFILRRFSKDIFAFFGSLFLVTVGTFVSRTVAGFVDTDAYNVFFPLMVVVFLLYGFLLKDIRYTILLSLIAGFFQGMFFWAWGPGWFIFVFILLSLLAYLGYILLQNLINKRKIKDIYLDIKNDVFVLISFILSSFIFSFLLAKKNIFLASYTGIFSAASNIASVSQSYIWPNVYSSVAELNPASFNQVIGSIGGEVIFILGMIGVVFLALDFEMKKEKNILYRKILIISSIIWFWAIISAKYFVGFTANNSLLFLILLFIPIGLSLIFSLFNDNKNSKKIFLAILLSVWIAGTIYMSLNGVRFILLLAPAFAISFALSLYYIARVVNSFFETEFKLEKPYSKVMGGYILVGILFLTLYIPMFDSASNISKNTLPNFDDAWYSSMEKIRINSSEDAIITSWWDFGHFFTAVAKRGVTFDGGSQTTPRSHWVGKLLMENDEEVSHDILQMLVCGGNEAHYMMLGFSEGTNSDVVKINKIIYDTLGKDSIRTRETLENNKYYNYSQEQIDEIIDYLSCDAPRENFLITSQDMIGKAGVWAHWGSWDFTKKYVHDNYKLLSSQEIANNIDENITLIEQYVNELNELDIRSETQNIKREDLLNQWFAPYPSYIPIQGRYEYPCTQQNSSFVCQNGIVINTLTNEVTVAAHLEGQISFSRLLFPSQNNTLIEIPQAQNGNVDVLLIPNQNGYNVMLMQYPLGGSLFTKLFYLNGFGTSKFEQFDDVQSATGVRVITWKTLWD